jgi:hypothetical protein
MPLLGTVNGEEMKLIMEWSKRHDIELLVVPNWDPKGECKHEITTSIQMA